MIRSMKHCPEITPPSSSPRVQVQWAVKSFKPFKSPGPDGIIPADIQHGDNIILPWLRAIYNASLRLIYTTWSWRISSSPRLDKHLTLKRMTIDQSVYVLFFGRHWKEPLMFILGPRLIQHFYHFPNMRTRAINQ